jgi:hypothetical protein
LPELAKLTKLRTLSLINKRLTSLPPNLSSLKELKTLFLRNNPFRNIERVVESLKTLPKLRELSINIKTDTDAQLIIDGLERLEMLNGEKIEGSDDEEIQSKSLADTSLDELAEAAKIYDLIRLANRPEGDRDLFKLFEAQMLIVVKELRNKLTLGLPKDIKKAMILKAKHVLVNTGFNAMIDNFVEDRNIANIWMQINKMYSDIFESLVALLVSAFSQELGGEKLKEHRENKVNSKEFNKKVKEAEQKDKIIAELVNKLKEAEENYNELANDFTKSQKQFEVLKEAAQKEIQVEKDKIESLNITIDNLNSQIKSEQNEKHLLHNQTDELLMQMASLEEENKKYLEMIIRRSKEISSNTSSRLSPDSSEHITNNSTAKNKGELSKAPLPIKKLKEAIEEIYNQKAKFDERYNNKKQPKMTMENFMFAYLEEKYESKQLAVKWAEVLVRGIKMYSKVDSDVALFGKILQNSCDEDYRLVHLEVKATIISMLAAELKKKNPSKNDETLLKIFKEMQKGMVDGWAWKEIVKKMYNEEDTKELITRLEDKVTETKNQRIPFTDLIKVQ